MGVRFGFSPVPRWRSKGVLGVALAAALLAETFVATTGAVAAPPAASASDAGTTRAADGTLQAPDIATARTIARLQNEKVEVVGERTESSSTYAFPDGTMATGQAAAPIWTRTGTGDGTAAADWSAVDLTLEAADDGTVRPKSHPGDIVLAGGGVPDSGALVQVSGADGQEVRVEWDGALPTPRLEGPRAVYPDVEPNVDLVVEVTRTGFEQFYVLTDRPKAGEEPDLSLAVSTDGLDVSETADGGVTFTDGAGASVGTTGTPAVWDAAVDKERAHPISTAWKNAGEKAGDDLSPLPAHEPAAWDRSAPPGVARPVGPALSTVPVAPPLPAQVQTSTEVPDGAGQATSEDAAGAKASPALPLEEAVTVGGDGDVDLSLSADAGYLQDRDTQYPVVIDPALDFAWGFDTFVQSGISGDQSGSAELRLGTYDGGATVARSFINFDVSSIRNRVILSAELDLYEWYSATCTPTNWQVWNTQPATTGARFTAQPAWYGLFSTSSQTTGYSAGCAGGWVGADVTSLVQGWSDGGVTTGGMGLRAQNETSNAGWKKFNSANAGGQVPTLWVSYDTPPGPASGLGVSGAVDNAGVLWTSRSAPILQATANDADGWTQLLFRVYKQDGTLVWDHWLDGDVANGSVGSYTVPEGTLQEGVQYYFVVHSADGVAWNTAPSDPSKPFVIDSSRPAAPFVTSTDYPSDGAWHKAEGQAGTFTFTLPGPDSTLSGIQYGLDVLPATLLSGTSTTASVTVTPATIGRHELQVRSIDKAGNLSPIVKYAFNVGRAGLTSPVEGANVVRRVQLAAAGESAFTHVRFAWRRGPEAGPGQPIDLSALARADGRALSDTWTQISTLGGYASWDAGGTVGAGPLQVQAVLASDAAGTGAYPTAWVTVTVSPDAKNAASDTVGPGTVNLLTGDYVVSSTDVDEFGLSLGRSASSRDPRAGLKPQQELLTDQQRAVSSVDGFGAKHIALPTRDTTRGHGGSDSLRVVPNAGDPDSYAYLSSPTVALRPGRDYRFTGWIYVPAATGLSPQSGDGLRLFVSYQDSNYVWKRTSPAPATRTDTWQQLSVDITIPADSIGSPFVAMSNGFSDASKEVLFDDLTLQEIWAPLGHQWSLESSEDITGAAYTHISQPQPDVADLHLAGGGEIWFTAGAGQRWWPEPGAESLSLMTTGPGQWRLTELDGTVSDFSSDRAPGVLQSGQRLNAGEQIVSANGGYSLVMQGDGNAVVYGRAQALWWTGTTTFGTYLVLQADGNLVAHNPNGSVAWNSGTWDSPGARLVMQDDGNLVLYRADGSPRWWTNTGSAAVLNSPLPSAGLTTTSAPAVGGSSRLVYENVNGRSRLKRMIAPVEDGVDGAPLNKAACTTDVPAVGCEVLELGYSAGTTATSTALGTFADRLTEVRLWSAPSATATTTDAVVAARYNYDERGRLREVWDPRISPALKTTYDYDADGRVVTLGPPGELPWRFGYGSGGSRSTVGAGDLLDRSSGRLLTVSRASLVPGTADQTGPDTTSTLVYAVPLTRADGGPHDLGPDTIATWAQRSGPTDATAIFGPEDVPSVTTADATTPGRDGYKPATVHYLDASGKEVNTATPSGPDAPAAGFIDTAEYDQYGNVVRSLDATNRLLALGQLPSAATDLAALNLSQADTATRAVALQTQNTYGPEGLDLLRTQGPLLRLAVGNDPNNVQLGHHLTTNVYDGDKPDGAAYHLLTRSTSGLLAAGSNPEQLLDVQVTENRYNPIDGASPTGLTSGWKVGKPTEVVTDPMGAALISRVRYDDRGRVVESRAIGSNGSDAGTTRAFFYSAGPNSAYPDCGNKPVYAGRPCKNLAAATVTGYDSSRMAGSLPVKTVTAYNRYGSALTVTESATGPVNGATVTQTRTTTTTYDGADRATSVLVAGSGAGTAAVPLAKTVTTYDLATGRATKVDGVDAATGAVVSTVRKAFDQLGRMTRYEDGNGGWTNSVYDKYGKPTAVNDSIGTSKTFTYDRTKEPRGYVTSVADSVAGTISASYGPDGQLTSQTLPGGVTLQIDYDASRNPVKRSYLRASDSAVIAFSAVVENSDGQWVTHTTAASTKRYAYDRMNRLTDVQDSITGLNSCTRRQYGYNNRSGRTSLSTSTTVASTCAAPGDPAAAPVSSDAYSYDSADRLVSETAVDDGAWVYDPLGRITSAPVRDTPGAHVANAYYANDLVASQTIDGVARQTWRLDALGRFASYANEGWASGTWQTSATKVNHYDSDGDSPAWISEDTSQPDSVTRYVDGLDGNLALQTSKAGNRQLQLVDLHGDVMSTLPISDGATPADWTGLQYEAADEFGNPTDLTTGAAFVRSGAAPGNGARYGWLGAEQRSAEALAGVVLMGVRLYDPVTGRFLSRDPVPGGNETSYGYPADPVNKTDLNGQMWKWLSKTLQVTGKYAGIASQVIGFIPGCAACAAASLALGVVAAVAAKANGGSWKDFGRSMLTTGVGVALGGFGKLGKLSTKALGPVARAYNNNLRYQGVVGAAERFAQESSYPSRGVLKGWALGMHFVSNGITTAMGYL